MAGDLDKVQSCMGQGSPMPEALRLEYLKAMGIQSWSARVADMIENVQVADSPVEEHLEPVAEVAPESPGEIEISSMDWPLLQARVAQCQRCDLHTSRTRSVLGSGDLNADLLIIGAAPDEEEDSAGEPFVGQPGLLLGAMLNAIGLNREQVYLSNVLKCRPPGDRKPYTSEIICCDSYLQRQIELIQPKLIMALGKVAANHLLVTQKSIVELRQRSHFYNGIPLLVSYHPVDLLAEPVNKKDSWQDLIRARQMMNG